VNYIARVNVLSGDRHSRIDAVRRCALAGASPCTQYVKRRVVSLPAAQESVSDIVGIDVVAEGQTRIGDVLQKRPLPCARACTWCVDGSVMLRTGEGLPITQHQRSSKAAFAS